MHRCRSISSYPLEVDGKRSGVDVEPPLGRSQCLGHRNRQNNMERDTCSIPNDPTESGFPWVPELLRGEWDNCEEWVWLVVKDSCRVLLLLLV